MTGLGVVLRSLREGARLTQEELAERSGLSARTVSDIERGLRRRLYADTAGRLADALGLEGGDRDDFLARSRGGDETPPGLDPGFRARFVAWHLAQVEQVAQDVGNEERWYAALDRDEDGVAVALRWADEACDATALLGLATGLWQYWQARGAYALGRRWLCRGLDVTPPAPAPLRARALWGLTWLASQQGDEEGAAEAATALDRIAETLEDPLTWRHAATAHGMVALAGGRPDAAEAELTRALGLARALGLPWLVAASELNLAIARIDGGRPARGLLDAALERFQAIGDRRFAARCLGYLGLLAITEHDRARAADLFGRSLTVFAALAEPAGTAEALTGLAAASTGRPGRAARLAGAAERLRESVGGRPLPVERRIVERLLAAERAAAGADAWDAAWVAGRALQLDAAIDLALTPSVEFPLSHRSVATPPGTP